MSRRQRKSSLAFECCPGPGVFGAGHYPCQCWRSFIVTPGRRAPNRPASSLRVQQSVLLETIVWEVSDSLTIVPLHHHHRGIVPSLSALVLHNPLHDLSDDLLRGKLVGSALSG